MQDAFTKLVQLMARLRGPDGCPWDRAQTANSLRPFLIEECYEVVDALDEGDPGKMKEELGDLLFQIIFHSRIAEEKGEFTISDVITANTEKMVRRHPHVFGDAVLATDREVLANWEQIKRQEKGHQDRTSMLEGVPRSLPALLRAHRLQERASRVGFDWARTEEVLEKLDEEIGEFKEAFAQRDAVAVEDELGDILFVLVNLSRFLAVDPEEALRKTTSKFIRRFRYIEEHSARSGRPLEQMGLEEMERLWQESKSKE
ncbi:MAG: nucleoside triphosphate pyrophosphohydrolase [Nitrospirae bacterium GWD2_57_8]|nr:MAG: nucleoside triphosphate pyrophosphohydrolase [Nitrospirae bacterium GWD2_57_8]HAR45947.1 nucleoside triphosphate pyrophosphohydrolase [Nitrospiraceae bacterium]